MDKQQHGREFVVMMRVVQCMVPSPTGCSCSDVIDKLFLYLGSPISARNSIVGGLLDVENVIAHHC